MEAIFSKTSLAHKREGHIPPEGQSWPGVGWGGAVICPHNACLLGGVPEAKAHIHHSLYALEFLHEPWPSCGL